MGLAAEVETLYRSHSTYVFFVASKFLNGGAGVEDVAQEVWRM